MAEYDKTLMDLYSTLAHQYQEAEPMRILDAGCAYGTFTAFWASQGHEVYAVDVEQKYHSPEFFEKYKIRFSQANLETDQIPFKEMDLIFFTEVVEHLNYNPVPVVKKLYDVLRPGGKIICTTPMKELQGVVHPIEGRYARYAHYRDIPLPWNGYEFQDDHHYFYRKHELMQLFHEVGFEVESCYSIRFGTTHYLRARK